MIVVTDSLDKIPEIGRNQEIGTRGSRRGGSSDKMSAGPNGLFEANIHEIGWGIGPDFQVCRCSAKADAAGIEAGSGQRGLYVIWLQTEVLDK